MTVSSPVFSLALDALQHDGVGSLSRVRKDALGICLRVNAEGMSSDVVTDLGKDLTELVDGFL